MLRIIAFTSSEPPRFNRVVRRTRLQGGSMSGMLVLISITVSNRPSAVFGPAAWPSLRARRREVRFGLDRLAFKLVDVVEALAAVKLVGDREEIFSGFDINHLFLARIPVFIRHNGTSHEFRGFRLFSIRYIVDGCAGS